MRTKTLSAWSVALLGGCLAAGAADANSNVKVTGITCFRGVNLAICELTLPGRTVRPIMGPGESSDGIAILSIDEKEGTVTLRHNNQSQTLSVSQADAPAGPPGRTFNLKAADSGQVLGIYQRLAERTVLASPLLPGAKIDLRSPGVLSTEAALNELDQAFAEKSIALVPAGTKFIFAVPASRVEQAQAIKQPDETNPSSEVIPVGQIYFNEAEFAQVLEIYQDLAGQTVLVAANTPRLRISLRSQTSLTRSEAIWALDSVFALGDVAILSHQAKFAIVRRSSSAALPKDFMSNRTSVADAGTKEIPASGLRFYDISSEEFLRVYADLCGREPLPIEADLPRSRINIRSQTPLTSAEAIYALDVLAAINRLQFVLVGDKQVKLVSLVSP